MTIIGNILTAVFCFAFQPPCIVNNNNNNNSNGHYDGSDDIRSVNTKKKRVRSNDEGMFGLFQAITLMTVIIMTITIIK